MRVRRPVLRPTASLLALLAAMTVVGSRGGVAASRNQGQGCSSGTPSLSAVDTCAPFALPDMQLRTTPEYRPPPEPKPLFLPPVVDSTRPPDAKPVRSWPSIKAGMIYASVRGILIGQGFFPAPSGRETSERCGAEPEICHDFPEVHACSGASVIVCEFVFERPGDALVVTTTGTRSLELVTRSVQRASALDLARHKVGR